MLNSMDGFTSNNAVDEKNIDKDKNVSNNDNSNANILDKFGKAEDIPKAEDKQAPKFKPNQSAILDLDDILNNEQEKSDKGSGIQFVNNDNITKVSKPDVHSEAVNKKVETSTKFHFDKTLKKDDQEVKPEINNVPQNKASSNSINTAPNSEQSVRKSEKPEKKANNSDMQYTEEDREAVDNLFTNSNRKNSKKSFIQKIMDGDQEAEDTIDYAINTLEFAIGHAGKFVKDKAVSGFTFIQNVNIVKKFRKGDIVQYRDFEFLRYDNELMLYKYNGTQMVLEIPAMVGNLPVTHINPGFLNFVKVKSVAKSFNSENIQYTSADSLKECFKGVKSIKLPNTLEILPGNVFHGCYNLQYIIIPASVEIIHPKAFHGCYPKAIYFSGPAPDNLAYCDIGKAAVFCKPEYINTYKNLINLNEVKATELATDMIFGEGDLE